MFSIKKKTVYSILAIIGLIIVVTILVYNFYIKKPTPQKIYNNSLSNIAELKVYKENVGEGYGTAVVINKNGYLVTNAHVITYEKFDVIETFDEYKIRFSDMEEYIDVELVNFDIKLDLAILKIDSTIIKKYKPISISKSKSVKTGDKVYAIGNALNYGISMTEGIISIPLLNMLYNGITREVMQCNIIINDGNSGGALINDKGKLIGIVTFRVKDKVGNIIYGLGYCIPADKIMEYLSEKIK